MLDAFKWIEFECNVDYQKSVSLKPQGKIDLWYSNQEGIKWHDFLNTPSMLALSTWGGNLAKHMSCTEGNILEVDSYLGHHNVQFLNCAITEQFTYSWFYTEIEP